MANGTREQALRIVVAEDERALREMLKDLLSKLGHDVVGMAKDGPELIEQCRAHRPDLIITDIVMPDTDGIEAATKAFEEFGIPSILVTGYDSEEFAARLEEAPGVYAYLMKPIGIDGLRAAIAVAKNRFLEFREVEQRLKDRPIIERAKEILMRRTGLDGAATYARMQKFSHDKNRKIVEISRAILITEEIATLEETKKEAP